AVIHVDVPDDRVGDDIAVARVLCVGDGGERAAKIGEGAAAAFAGAAVVTRVAAVVRLREDRRTADGDGAAEFSFDSFAEQNFAAAHFHRRQKQAVGQHLVAFGGAGDANIFFDDIVERSHVGVGDRPVIAVAVAAGGF